MIKELFLTLLSGLFCIACVCLLLAFFLSLFFIPSWWNWGPVLSLVVFCIGLSARDKTARPGRTGNGWRGRP